MITHVARVKKIGKDGLSVSTNLILDLHADSLDMAEFKSVIQSNYTTASNPPITRIKTIGDLAALALGKLEGEERLLPVDFPQALDAKIEFAYQS